MMIKHRSKVISAMFFLGILSPAICVPQIVDTTRPKIGLVLSGGGARGAAHVGVIKVLDEMRIPIDYIAGTSMGAIIGGLYASGINANELEQVIGNTDWVTLLADRPPRARRSFRRKADDFGFLVDFDVGVNKDGLVLPRGIVQGQTLTLELRRLLLPVATIDDFDRLPTPFRAVATNITSGEAVILDSGDLALAIRASMSAPGVFNPMRIDDQVLVDGGVANNLPVGIAKAMGADVLIVVDVGFPLAEEAELNSPFKITSQMLTILINARAEQQKLLMTPRDVLISPELGRLGSQEFGRTREAIRLGEATARQLAKRLTNFSVSEAAYVAHRRSIEDVRLDDPIIHRMALENDSRLSSEVLEAHLTDQRGKPLDVEQLESDIADIYGFDTFETVDYSIRASDHENELVIRSKDKHWGPNYLRFGINLEDDFSGTSNYNLAARFTKTEINRRGGEFRADVVIGEEPQLAVELYQPLDYESRWFVNPAFSFQRTNEGLFGNGSQIAQFRSEDTELSLGVGRQFGNWGELRFQLTRGFSDSEIQIGDPAFGGGSGDATTLGLRFSYDTIDRVAIPRFGTSLTAAWLGLREGFGADQTADLAQLFVLKPQTWGHHTFLHWWDLGSVTKSRDTSINAFELGGLFNLSGYASDELNGQHLAIGRLLYYRRLGEGRMPILDTPVYVGGSLEAGNVWQETKDISLNNTLIAGSVFVVVDTVIGPLYLAYGAAEGGRRSFYLFLGQTF